MFVRWPSGKLQGILPQPPFWSLAPFLAPKIPVMWPISSEARLLPTHSTTTVSFHSSHPPTAPIAPSKVNRDAKVSNGTNDTTAEKRHVNNAGILAESMNASSSTKAQSTDANVEPKLLLPEDDLNIEKGSISKVKDIYGSKDDDDVWTWIDEPPENLKEAAKNEKTEKYALIVRNKKSSDSRKSLEAHSIIIHSP